MTHVSCISGELEAGRPPSSSTKTGASHFFRSADILVGPGVDQYAKADKNVGARALGKAHTPKGASPFLAVLPARQRKETASWIRAWRATGSERIVRRTAGVKTTATRTRYGLMRLTRLRAMSEVRSTAASPPGEAGAKPVQNAKHRRNRGAWGGWRRNVRKCVCLNRGDLSWCWKEQGRSQSPHSSRETGNDRGAKGGRKVEA